MMHKRRDASRTWEPEDVEDLLRSLPSSASHVLLVLLLLNRPVSQDDLLEITFDAASTMLKALSRLEKLALVDYLEGTDAWTLTAKGKSLQTIWALLTGYGKVPESSTVKDIKNFFSAPCSTGTINHDPGKKQKKRLQQQKKQPRSPPQTPKTHFAEPPQVPDDPDLLEACQLLRETGVGQTKAAQAVLQALETGWDARQIRDAVAGWLRYAATERGKTIDHAGFLAVARVAAHEPPPDSEEPDAQDPSRYISGKFGHLIQH